MHSCCSAAAVLRHAVPAPVSTGAARVGRAKRVSCPPAHRCASCRQAWGRPGRHGRVASSAHAAAEHAAGWVAGAAKLACAGGPAQRARTLLRRGATALQHAAAGLPQAILTPAAIAMALPMPMSLACSPIPCNPAAPPFSAMCCSHHRSGGGEGHGPAHRGALAATAAACGGGAAGQRGASPGGPAGSQDRRTAACRRGSRRCVGGAGISRGTRHGGESCGRSGGGVRRAAESCGRSGTWLCAGM